MDCAQVMELLDAYALGASDRAEAHGVERHVADCVRCWEELTRAQRTAAMLALAIPMKEAPARLENRIMREAEREKVHIRTQPRPGLFQRLRWTWPATAATFGAVSAVALAFAAFLQVQVQDLRDDRNLLQEQVRAANVQLTQQLINADTEQQQQKIFNAVFADPSAVKLPVTPTSETGAAANYNWSPTAQKGFVTCSNLPPLPAGKVYQVWFTAQNKATPMATFRPSYDGTCRVTMDLSNLDGQPAGIGISREDFPGSADRPTTPWLMYAHLPSAEGEAEAPAEGE